jgi:PAS domain S-box-containing protein
MTMLMLASGWVLTTVRRSLPSFQRLTGALIFIMTALIATQVMLPLPQSLSAPPDAANYFWSHWSESNAAPIVITLAIVLAGVLDGLLAAVAVTILAQYTHSGLGLELILPIAWGVVCGLVVRRYWGLHRDYISNRLLMLIGLSLAIPQLIVCFKRIGHGQDPWVLAGSLALMVVAYPVATVVVGSLLTQPYHQIQMETKLLDSEERNRQMVRLAGNAIVNFNANLEIIDYNEEAERVFGYPRQYLIGRRYLALLFPSYSWEGIENDAERVMAGGQIREHEVQVTSRDGEETPMIWSFSRISNARGESLGLMAIGQDISLRKKHENKLAQNEERVRLALSGADLGMWDWNLATDEVVFSERWAQMLGFTLEELNSDGASWDERIHPEDRDHVLACMEDHLSGETEQFEVEHRLRRQDGTYIWVLSRARVIQRNNEDQPLRMTGTLLDISQRIASEQEHRRLERQLRHSQKMETIGTLAGGIAHDFNNILQGIMGYTTLGKTRLAPADPVQQDLDKVLQASERASNLVDQMLVFSRQSQQSRAIVDMEQVWREALRVLGPKLKRSPSIEVKLSVAEDCPQLLADPTQIQQVVMNLATNALHAMRESGGILSIELSRLPAEAIDPADSGLTDRPAAWLHMLVRDTGSGIDPRHISRLFEPFFTTKSVAEGTGLGLSVVHGIVTSHGGSIEVDSTPGVGSSFTVMLPVLADMAS